MVRKKPLRNILGSLLALVAINAFAGGYYGLAGARGIPVEWLRNSPFTNYSMPSLILIAIVGGACATASVLVFKKSKKAGLAAFIAGAVILAWMLVQVSIIGYVSWMQPTVFTAGVVVFSLSLLLQKMSNSFRQGFNM